MDAVLDNLEEDPDIPDKVVLEVPAVLVDLVDPVAPGLIVLADLAGLVDQVVRHYLVDLDILLDLVDLADLVVETTMISLLTFNDYLDYLYRVSKEAPS